MKIVVSRIDGECTCVYVVWVWVYIGLKQRFDDFSNFLFRISIDAATIHIKRHEQTCQSVRLELELLEIHFPEL